VPHPTDTIAAIATANGPGAIGIVRLSGPGALPIAQTTFTALTPAPTPRHLYHGWVVHPTTHTRLDEAMAVFMPGPHTFTGEDCAEIYAHGGVLNLSRVLDAVIEAGARHARPGEFTLRAFLNGRIDLSQAEAVADIINADSDAALNAAQAQLGGAVARPIAQLRERLLHLIVQTEHAIDFDDEGLYTFPTATAQTEILALMEALQRLLRQHHDARLRTSGLQVAFVGAPNAGKSSLFNALLGRDRAIVTPIAGTTRDTIEEPLTLAGQRFNLIDTAGLNHSPDPVERLGIARTHHAAATAHILCWVIDLTAPLPSQWPDFGSTCPVLVACSKADLVDPKTPMDAHVSRWLAAAFPGNNAPLPPYAMVSATDGSGIAQLETQLLDLAERCWQARSQELPFMVSVRHAEAVRQAHAALQNATRAIDEALPMECLGADLRAAADALATITGTIATDTILDAIFSRFCVGK